MDTVISLIGNSPLIELTSITENKNKNRLFVKAEGFNPSGSVKDRIILKMIENAEMNGEIQPGDTLVESSSGNTGVSLAMIGNIKGYKVIIFIDPNAREMHVRKMKAFGANVICITEKDELGRYQVARISRLKRYLEENQNVIWLNQYSNEMAISAHYENTGEEICNAIDNITHFIGPVSTGNTLLGTAKKIKEYYPAAKIIAVDSEGSSIFASPKGSTRLKGIGSKFVTAIVKKYRDLIDDARIVSDRDAFEHVILLAKKESIFAGPTSGCVLKAMLDIDRETHGGNIVGILADRGDSYIESDCDEVWLYGIDNYACQEVCKH